MLAATAGKAYIDYAFHVAPILREHIDEIPMMVEEFGVPSFKIFMFYGSHGLHGAVLRPGVVPDDPGGPVLRLRALRVRDAGHRRRPVTQFPDDSDRISLSLHCETAEIMRAYTKLVEQEGTLTGLEAYSASRPPHSEGLAITIASYLAHETELPNINLLHLAHARRSRRR